MLKIKDLNFSYGKNAVISQLHFEVKEGSVHGIFGKNGAGKSTLFRLIFGLLKPENGEILWNEAPIRPENVSFLETENYFYPFLKGAEYLRIITLDAGTADPGWNEIFELPLQELVDGYSTGMKKKLAIYGILLQNRPLLLLDEPFNGVDLESNERLFHLIQNLSAKGKTILISSHILESLTRLCDEISCLENGAISKTYLPSEFGMLERDLRSHFNKEIEEKLQKMV